MELDAEIDALFAGSPDEFVAARNGLVKRLRAVGRRQDAERVAALRRPSVVAWALNEVARQQPGVVERLLASGAELQQAQRRLLSGIRDDRLRNATRRRRELIQRLTDEASTVLTAAGRPASHRPELAATLEAASVDHEVGETLRAGRLTSDVPPPSGFGDLAGLFVAEPPEASEPPAAAGPGEEPGLAEARADLERAEADAAAAAGHVDAARARAAIARREADQAATTAQRLQAEADAAQHHAERAAVRAEREDAAVGQALEDQRRRSERLERARQRLRDLDEGG